MNSIAQLFGDKAEKLLDFKNPKIRKDRTHIPSQGSNQGIDHFAHASFAKNADYFDFGKHHLRLRGTARDYANWIRFLVKINHNEQLTYPNKFDRIMGADAVGATIHFGSEQADVIEQKLPENSVAKAVPVTGARHAGPTTRNAIQDVLLSKEVTVSNGHTWTKNQNHCRKECV